MSYKHVYTMNKTCVGILNLSHCEEMRETDCPDQAVSFIPRLINEVMVDKDVYVYVINYHQ